MKIIHTNVHKVEQQTNELKAALQGFNEIITELNAFNLGVQVKDSNDLTDLVNNPESWIKEKLIEGVQAQTVTVFGIALKTKPAKLIDLIDMPDLSTLIGKCKAVANDIYLLRRINVTNKKCTLNPNAIEEITLENSIVANTPHAKQASEALNIIAKGVSEYNAIARANEASPLNNHSLSMLFNLTGIEPQLSEQYLRTCGLFN